MSESKFEMTSTNTVRRAPNNAHYDRNTIYEILDANLIAHVALVGDDGNPLVIPMLFARRGDELLFHGSTKSRLMNGLCSGTPVCVSTTQLDGLVLAKSLFHHSMNYRSVFMLGRGFEVTDDDQRWESLKIITDKTMPGRWHDARQPNAGELKATRIAAVKIETASAKIRTGPPKDDQEDLKLPVWAGVIPISMVAQHPVASGIGDRIPAPDYIYRWQSGFGQDQRCKRPQVTHPAGGFRPRKTNMHTVKTIAGRQFKVYTICAPGKQPDSATIQAAVKHAGNQVHWPHHDSGYGFLTVHFGDCIWLLVDVWKGDILCHFVFQSDYSDSSKFMAGPADGTTACVWELQVTHHERDAWVRHVMCQPDQPNFDAYVSDCLTIAE